MRSLMLVSAAADQRLRADVKEGARPRPEYLRLEEEGVDLLDWSRLDPPHTKRSWLGSVRHVRAALDLARRCDVVFSDGEPVGVPMALAMMARGIELPHLMLGHRLTARHKRLFFRIMKSHRGMTRILVHSHRQLEAIPPLLGVPRAKLAFIPYYADGAFWRPQRHPEEQLVVAAGREQRDYETLVAACSERDVSVFIADGSVHTPGARHRGPAAWPENVRAGFADYRALRDLYASAAVVAVPLIENDFQAGVTTLLEAMAMGKAVVVTATSGQVDVVEDGVTGLTVPPGDVARLRHAIRFLLEHPRERKRLGRNAKDAFESGFTLDAYTAKLLEHLDDIATGRQQALPVAERPTEAHA
jgi:hypothetical protein